MSVFRALCSNSKEDLQAFYFGTSVALSDVSRTTHELFQLKKKFSKWSYTGSLCLYGRDSIPLFIMELERLETKIVPVP